MTQWNEVARTKAEEIDPTVAGGDLAMGFEAPAGRSQWRLAFRRFLRHRVAMVGVVALLIIVFACFVGVNFAPSPTEQHLLEPQAGPSAAHWFGTDELSRDTLSRVLHGGQVSIRVGLGVAILSTIIGTLVGLLAGFYGGLRDDVFMRVTDLSIALPSLPLLALAESIGVVTILGFSLDLGSPNGITILVSLLLWGSIARVVRGVTLSLREKEFVEAAGALGASNRRIIMRHILPNCVGPIIVNATLTVATAILLETTLSFLGFGIQPPAASWGNLVSGSLDSLQDHWWQTVFPGMAIFITVLAVNFVGDGLRDALDPKQRQLRA